MNLTDVSFELLHKYNVQGPRYTSYPPAPSWKSDIGPAEYEAQIVKGNNSSELRPLSLYFHLPFCEKLCYFCGCTTIITGRNRSFVAPYLESIGKEIEWLSERLNPKRKIIQFHLGGGTPTYNSPDELNRLLEKVNSALTFHAEAEMGVEVDPRVTTTDHLRLLRKWGFNRISMGVQDFNPQVQEAINRIQPFEETKLLIDAAREMGFVSVNIDLIYGLPYQTAETFEQTIKKILKLNPDRLAVYSYAHVPWLKKHQEHFVRHLPDERGKFGIFQTALKKFTEAGFEYIGMDHFAKENDELSRARRERTLWRNFQGYTTKAGTDLFGLGMSAIGHVQDGYFQNEKELKNYQELVGHNKAATIRGFILSKDDKVRARVVQNLLCHAEVIKTDIEKEFQIKFDSYFSSALQSLKEHQSDGLVELLPDRIRPTSAGRVFLRNLAMPFDIYLPKENDKKIFSRTV